ncbi:dihydroorotase [Cytophagales bacterium LB-30]|uniref:Dihydroorotase n=1 Tax=Shiella aurantiaca TaxID=3058365 RepID=A0ABT8F9B8_9BACT|nr:dihydroorotase [Shiella aurantiaca]MDN4166973.1 dihydroorotase [Shiella aurantiaca]
MTSKGNILLQSVEIVDTQSAFHGKKKDILIEGGKITQIADYGTLRGSNDSVFTLKNLYVSPGFFDLGTLVHDPGNEYREDLHSAKLAALMGGFTDLAILPNTQPVIDDKKGVQYIRSHSREVDFHALAAVTKGAKGEELTDMIDLNEAGALGFTDGVKSLYHPDILLKTLQYLQKFNGLLINHPEDKWLSMFGQMHEGVVSTELGLRGIPSLAEEIIITRDLRLLEFAGGKIHFSGISTKEAVELIRKAKEKGLAVSCDVAIPNLLYTDEALRTFNTSLKLSPPLRSEADQAALIEGLLDDTIDAIVSGHRPWDEESKKVEFDMAEAGMLMLPTFWPALVSLKNRLPLEKSIEKITQGPRAITSLPQSVLAEGATAKLTLWSATEEWTFDSATNPSKSENSPYFGNKLTGKVKAVINRDYFSVFQ